MNYGLPVSTQYGIPALGNMEIFSSFVVHPHDKVLLLEFWWATANIVSVYDNCKNSSVLYFVYRYNIAFATKISRWILMLARITTTSKFYDEFDIDYFVHICGNLYDKLLPLKKQAFFGLLSISYWCMNTTINVSILCFVNHYNIAFTTKISKVADLCLVCSPTLVRYRTSMMNLIYEYFVHILYVHTTWFCLDYCQYRIDVWLLQEIFQCYIFIS